MINKDKTMVASRHKQILSLMVDIDSWQQPNDVLLA
jgi:hypothetical protein